MSFKSFSAAHKTSKTAPNKDAAKEPSSTEKTVGDDDEKAVPKAED